MLLEARKPAWYGVIASCESTLDARQIARSLHRQGTHTPKTLPKLGAGVGAAATPLRYRCPRDKWQTARGARAREIIDTRAYAIKC
jgi:hypothetical protein